MSWIRHLYFKLLYLREPPWDTQVSPPELLDFIAQHPPGRALDLGCGTGTNVITLAQHGWLVTGVDYIGRALRQAKEKARRAGVKADFLLGDVTKLEKITGFFDLILDIGCFHSLNNKEKEAYVQNLERLTNPDSYYMLYGFLQVGDGNGPGLRISDLIAFETIFDQVRKEEGLDRGRKPSVWLTYMRKSSGSIV